MNFPSIVPWRPGKRGAQTFVLLPFPRDSRLILDRIGKLWQYKLEDGTGNKKNKKTGGKNTKRRKFEGQTKGRLSIIDSISQKTCSSFQNRCRQNLWIFLLHRKSWPNQQFFLLQSCCFNKGKLNRENSSFWMRLSRKTVYCCVFLNFWEL